MLWKTHRGNYSYLATQNIFDIYLALLYGDFRTLPPPHEHAQKNNLVICPSRRLFSDRDYCPACLDALGQPREYQVRQRLRDLHQLQPPGRELAPPRRS